VQQYNKKNIIIMGYDATPPAVDAILSGGPMKADVVQYPDKIGQITIQTINEYFNGKKVPAEIPVEVGIFDKNSLSRK